MSADRFGLPRGELRTAGLWRRVLLVVLAWAGVTVFLSLLFAAQHIGDDTSIVFIFYSNAVHYALWALALPLIGVCVRRFPVHLGPRLRTRTVLALVGICLVCARS